MTSCASATSQTAVHQWYLDHEQLFHFLMELLIFTEFGTGLL